MHPNPASPKPPLPYTPQILFPQAPQTLFLSKHSRFSLPRTAPKSSPRHPATCHILRLFPGIPKSFILPKHYSLHLQTPQPSISSETSHCTISIRCARPIFHCLGFSVVHLPKHLLLFQIPNSLSPRRHPTASPPKSFIPHPIIPFCPFRMAFNSLP